MGDTDFEEQLRQEELAKVAEEEKGTAKEMGNYVDPDGTEYEWDKEKKAWFPKIDNNFIAEYQMKYGTYHQDENSTSSTQSNQVTDYKQYYKDYYDYYRYYAENYQNEAKDQDAEDSNSVGSAKDSENTEKSERDAKMGWNEKDYMDYDNYYYYYYYYHHHQNQNSVPSEDGVTEKLELPLPGQKRKSNATPGTDKTETDTANDVETGSEVESIDDAVANTEAKSELQPTKDSAADPFDPYYYYYYYHNQQISSNEESPQEGEGTLDTKGGSSSDKKGKNAKVVEKRPNNDQGWFDVDEEKNTNVYVSGLPLDVTDEEFRTLMAKCGLIMFDPLTNKPKLKLYRDANGNPKGDGRCCYIKVESVELALQILDGYNFRDKIIHVERAKFQMKGDYDPKKKRRKIDNKAKRKFKERQEKLFDWRPSKPINTRYKHEKTVILKNMFGPEDFEDDPMLINDLREDVQAECSKFGDVRKMVIYDAHPDGVISVSFREAEEADECVLALNRRWFAKRRILALTWDGKTKFEVQESEAVRDIRLKKWETFLEGKTEEKLAAKKLSPSTSSCESYVAVPPVKCDPSCETEILDTGKPLRSIIIDADNSLSHESQQAARSTVAESLAREKQPAPSSTSEGVSEASISDRQSASLLTRCDNQLVSTSTFEDKVCDHSFGEQPVTGQQASISSSNRDTTTSSTSIECVSGSTAMTHLAPSSTTGEISRGLVNQRQVSLKDDNKVSPSSTDENTSSKYRAVPSSTDEHLPDKFQVAPSSTDENLSQKAQVAPSSTDESTLLKDQAAASSSDENPLFRGLVVPSSTTEELSSAVNDRISSCNSAAEEQGAPSSTTECNPCPYEHCTPSGSADNSAYDDRGFL